MGWQLKEEQEGGPGLLQPSAVPCEGIAGGLRGSWGPGQVLGASLPGHGRTPAALCQATTFLPWLLSVTAH